MADIRIDELTELTSVDRAADFLEVADASDSNKSKRSSVNSLLDLASHPVGITDTQTLTNKTITAPAISGPVLSGTVTGTYTLGGTPTFPAAVVTLTGNQTLTNKTLTSPTINAPTITNPTVTVDTISEFTSAAGVTIDGVLLKDSRMSGTYLTDATVTSAKLTDKNYQTDNNNVIGNTTGGNVTIQVGWGQVLGDGSAAFETSVTLPTAYTTILGVSVCLLPVKATTAATSITDLTADYSTVVSNAIVAAPISTTGFNVLIQRASGTFSATTYYGFSWIAWGVI